MAVFSAKMGKRLILAVVLLGAAAGGFAYWDHSSGFESTDDAQIDGNVHPVSSRVSGTVMQVLVNDNQYVEAGAVLVVLDPKDYQVELNKSKADLAEAEATTMADRTQVPIVSTTSTSQLYGAEAVVLEAKANISAAEKQEAAARARVISAQALVLQAKANADRAARDLDRYKVLLAKDEISQQQYDAAQAAAVAQRAQWEASQAQQQEAEQAIHVAHSQLELQEARLVKAQADAKSAETGPQQVAATRAKADSTAAKVLQMKAQVEQSELSLSYTTVKAPVSGVVSQKSVQVGQIVQAGQPLLSVVPLDDIWATANFKENQLARMRVGQKVRIAVDAYGGREYEAHVQSIAAATGSRFSLLPAENATGNYVKVVQRVPVKIVLEKGQDKEHVLRPGMSVIPTVYVR